jgi:hypothetical protein
MVMSVQPSPVWAAGRQGCAVGALVAWLFDPGGGLRSRSPGQPGTQAPMPERRAWKRSQTASSGREKRRSLEGRETRVALLRRNYGRAERE